MPAPGQRYRRADHESEPAHDDLFTLTYLSSASTHADIERLTRSADGVVVILSDRASTEELEKVIDPFAQADCDESSHEVFSLLGRRWTGLIIAILMQRPSRFGEIAKAIPSLTDGMLSARLGELVAAGLVEREVLEGLPMGALYRLTDKGEALRSALDAPAEWGEQHLITA